MNKKIITIAEIVFALVFVVLLAVFMATINSKGNDANNQLVNVLGNTGTGTIESFQSLEGTTCKGTVVVDAATNYHNLTNDGTKIQVKVVTGRDGKTVRYYGYLTMTGTLSSNETQLNKEKAAQIKKGDEIGKYNKPASNAKDYINPNGDFEIKVESNSNGVLSSLIFTQTYSK